MSVGTWDELLSAIAKQRIPAASFKEFISAVHPALTLLSDGSMEGAARLGQSKAKKLQLEFAAMLALHYVHGLNLNEIYGFHDSITEGMSKALGLSDPVGLNLRRMADREGDSLLALAKKLSYQYPTAESHNHQLKLAQHRQSSAFNRASKATPQFSVTQQRKAPANGYTMFGLPSAEDLANE